MSALGQDLRYAFRLLLKSPGFTAVAVLSLALGIGANATVFSVLNALFLRPLPVAQPHEVAAVFTSDYSGPLFGASSYPDFLDFQGADAFSSLAAYTLAPLSLSQGSQTDRVFGELVTANYFEVAGVGAARGRVLRSQPDGEPGAEPVLVISDAFWKRRFGGDPSVVGKPVTLNGRPFTIAGVTAPGFTGMLRGMAMDVWVPLTAPGAIAPADRLLGRGNRWLFLIGRLGGGRSVAFAQARLTVVAAQLQKSYPENWTDVRKNRRVITVVPESQARVFPAARGAVLGFVGLLGAVVGLVLLLACTNVASLLLARAAARRRETALRLSLGASRGRLIRQLLTESVVLALIAGGVGVLLAYWTTDLLMAIRPPVPVPVELNLQPDLRVLAFSLLLSIATGVVFGLVPALQASRPELLPALKDEALSFGRALGTWSPRRLLVVAQVAMSLVLLIGAGLFLQSLRNAHRIDPGFEPQNMLLLSTDLRLNGYPAPAGREFYRQLLERAAAVPGVTSASLASEVPLGLGGSRRGFSIEGYARRADEDMEIHSNIVGPAYFRTMGMPLERGRDFASTDVSGSGGVAIVNQAFARRYWPGLDALGKRVGLGTGVTPNLEVIAVAKDGKYATLGEDPKPFVYLAFFQSYRAEATLHVRTLSEPQRLIAAMRRQVEALDPSLPVYDVKTMTDHMGLSLLPARLAGSVLGMFGVVALALAAIGIYGVMAHAVSQRTRELGVRIAIGARPGDLLGMVVSQGMRLAGVGVVIGLVLALGVTRLAASLLYGISATDPATFAGISLLLAAIAFAASYLPARRATRVDPIVALRSE